MIIREDIIWSTLQFSPSEQSVKNEIVSKVDSALAVKIPGAEFSPAYKRGFFDGLKHFYDKKTDSFPTGLIKKVERAFSDTPIGVDYKINDVRPDKFVDPNTLPDKLTLNVGTKKGSFVLRDYQVKAVKALFEHGTGVINYSVASGKTAIGASIIKQAIDKLEPDEHIAFFTNSRLIFTQSVKNLKSFLGCKIGQIAGSKRDIQKVTVCMIPTVYSALSIDPEARLALTPREGIYKKIAKTYYPRFKQSQQAKQDLGGFLLLFTPKYKTDLALQEFLQKIYDTSDNDDTVIAKLYHYAKAYDKVVQTKHSEEYKKNKAIHDFLDSVVLFVADECHHSKSDTWVSVLMACRNAIYRAGLSGSVDIRDEVVTQSLDAIYGGIIAKVKAKEMIDRGVTSKPVITMLPINEPKSILSHDWQDIYKKGIVYNNYRNNVIALLAKEWFKKDTTVLIIVQWLDQYKEISKYLEALNVPYAIIDGTQEDAQRKQELEDVASGKTKVLIATSVLDEGVDISNIDVLILASGGKSLRQIVQRIGRTLRKDKNSKTDRAYIFDFIDNQNRILKKHSNERLAIYREEQFEVLGIK